MGFDYHHLPYPVNGNVDAVPLDGILVLGMLAKVDGKDQPALGFKLVTTTGKVTPLFLLIQSPDELRGLAKVIEVAVDSLVRGHPGNN